MIPAHPNCFPALSPSLFPELSLNNPKAKKTPTTIATIPNKTAEKSEGPPLSSLPLPSLLANKLNVFIPKKNRKNNAFLKILFIFA